jgi:hypothetical protein
VSGLRAALSGANAVSEGGNLIVELNRYAVGGDCDVVE